MQVNEAWNASQRTNPALNAFAISRKGSGVGNFLGIEVWLLVVDHERGVLMTDASADKNREKLERYLVAAPGERRGLWVDIEDLIHLLLSARQNDDGADTLADDLA